MATETAEIGLVVYNLSPQRQTQQSSSQWGQTGAGAHEIKKKKKRIDYRELRVETGMVRKGQGKRGQ